MKKLIALLVVSTSALGHPGHGKPGFIHEHTLGDVIIALLMVAVVALAGWALLRILRNKDL